MVQETGVSDANKLLAELSVQQVKHTLRSTDMEKDLQCL